MAPQTSTYPKPKPPLKILMLHGYTQSGPLFHAKSRALEKHLQKSFPLHSVSLSYPTGPLHLSPSDIPDFQPSSTAITATNDDYQPESYAWWRRSSAANPPEYLGLDEGFETVARLLAEEGPFDGVIGFSQGAAFAAIVASLLESERKSAFEYFADIANNNSSIPSSSDGAGDGAGEPVTGIPFPTSFKNLTHPPFKFAICYSGFIAPGTRYRAFYERPRIQTPVLHVLGSLDAIVEEGRSRMLICACEGDAEKEGKVIWHPGGHFLPSQRPYLDGAVRFIRECLERVDKGAGDRLVEEKVEDMEMPF
ncbi:dihydrofolate reductase [[Emmonsia] crescens]|uniref:Dihydrofolate reductase n=1 Tax=[Emmonsia] crescens TaxID=73230 RepID=A0A0G2HR33_9EURO|nr:dihydrofolate reductase [Emmonsia crescens UAMH 3008]